MSDIDTFAKRILEAMREDLYDLEYRIKLNRDKVRRLEKEKERMKEWIKEFEADLLEIK